MWKDLNIQQKSEVMKMAISQGLTDLNEIKKMYDASIPNIEASSVNNTYSSVPYNPSPKNVRYDGGGWLSYLKWKDAIGKYKGIDTNDPAYDYAGFYIENPERAWALLNDNPNAHFVDTYKTVYHPTFSDESMYSGMVSPQYNPEGLVGGSWRKYPNSFTMSTDLYRSPVSMDERIQYLENNEPEGVVLREYDGSLPMFNDGSLWGGVKPTVEVSPYAYGGPLGNIYKGTGNKSQNLNIWASGAWTADDLASELLKLGVRARVTSKGRSAKQQAKFNTPANRSWHVKNKAIDVVPTTNWDDLKADLLKPEVRSLFNSAGIGVLDERPASVQKKTGATGAHFHIGPDRSARAGYAAWTNSKMPNGPQINIESPVFHTAANDLQWQPPIVASSRQEDIAPLLVQDNKPLIVEPLDDTSSTPKDFSAIWDQIFPKVENTQEEFNPLLDPSTQFTALQSRPRYQMKPTPIINMPTSDGDNDYMLFKPLAKGGNLFGTGSYLRNYQWMTMPQTDTVYTDYETGLPIQAGQKVWADAQGNLVTVETPNALEDYAAQYKPNASFYGPVLDQVNVTGTVNPNKPMPAQPDAFAERYAQLLAAPIASNADVDKVFEEQGQWQWEQSKEKHDADVKAADLEIQKLHPIDDILPKIPEYIAAPFRYTGQYLFNAFDSDFIDLSNKRVSEINSDTKNIESILFNDFIENNSNSFRSAKNYKVTNDTLIGDKHIPLSQINTFWGVENGKLKVAPIEAFDDNTIVAPNRAKGSKEHLKEVVINPEWKGYDRKKNKENATKAREYAEEEAKRMGIKPSIMSKILRPYRSLIQGYPALMDVREALSNDAYLELIDRATDMYPTSPPPSVYLGVTENNDTIPIQIVGPKMFLGNESGNAAFISQPIEHMQEINNFLRNNPSYIGLPDNGRYSGYQLSNPSYIGYRGPTTAPMFVVGTIK